MNPDSPNLRRLLLAAASAALLATLPACTEAQTKTETAAEPRAVVAQAATYEARVPARSFVGTVRPRVESDLGFRVAGKVSERRVQNGDRIKAGQVLATLDLTDLKLQHEQAESELAAAQASLAQADAEERRITQLRRSGWSTASNAERQRALVEEARGRLNRAERSVSLAANSLDYATLKADADGIVTATFIEPGQVVAQGVPAIRLARIDAREAVVAIPEALVDRVRTAQASVALWSEPGRNHPAVLRELSPSADPATRTYQARFTIIDPPAGLEFGLTATVTLNTQDSEKVVRLPLSALFSQGQGAMVYVANPDDGHLTLKPVDVLGFEARDVLVRGGLGEGEMVVTLGVQKLDPAQRVRIVRQ